MNLRILLVLFLLPVSLLAGEAEAWKAVLALEAGPSLAREIQTREAARKIVLEHLAKQETALRAYLKAHPKGAHVLDAHLRLARLYATRSDFSGNAADFDTAIRLLERVIQTAPAESRADVDFTRIGLYMRRIATPVDLACDDLYDHAIAFQQRYPDDRRVAPLLVEVATLFDAEPRRKKNLLQRAHMAARTPEVRARIEDDMHRLALLGQPLPLHGTTADGKAIDLADYRGKVVLLYFFASWSAPGVAGLESVQIMRKSFVGEQFVTLGISLDSADETLQELLRTHNVTWPVIQEKEGWKSPLIRGFHLNALPSFWLIDRKGALRSLNARVGGEMLVKELLQEP